MASDPQIQTELQQALQNAILQEREQAAQRQVAWLSTIAEIANLLLKTADYKAALPEVVRLLGEAVGSDRCLIIQELPDPATGNPWLEVLAEWAEEGVAEVSADIPEGEPQMVVDGDWADLHGQLQRGELTNYVVADMPEPWRGFLEAQGVVSSASVPIMVGGQFWGHIDFDSCSEARLYDATEIGILQTAAEMIAGAIARSAEDKALRESEQRYRTLFEMSSEGIYRFEFDQPISLDLSVDEQVELTYRYWHVAEANDAYLTMYNLDDADDPVGLRLTEVHVPGSAKNQAMMRAYSENGCRIHNMETEEVDFEGNPRYFLNNVIGIVKDGYTTGGWGSQLDITELRLAQQAFLEAEQARSRDLTRFNTELRQTLEQLAESEERYRTLFEISSEGIYRFEFDEPISLDLPVDEQVELVYRCCRVIGANATYAAMYGLDDPGELAGFRLLNLHVMESPQNQAMMQTYVENGYQLHNTETEEVDLQGNRRYFLNNIATIIKDGYAIGGWASQLDITERRLAQQALLEAEQGRSQELAGLNAELQQTLERLAESEERYRTLFEISSEGIYRFEFEQPIPIDLPVDEQIDLIYQHYRMVEANSTYAALYNEDNPEALVGLRLTDVHAVGSAQNQATMRAFVENGYQFYNAETEQVDLEGNRRYFLNNAVTVIKNGHAIGGWASHLDITERRLAQQALLEAEQNRVAKLAKTNQALKNSLDRLAADPDFNAFLGYVLLEITQQLSLDIAVLRFYNATTQTLPLELLVEKGQIKQKEQIQAPTAYLCPTAVSLPVWETLLRTKRPFIMTQENADAGVRTDQISDLQVTVNLLLKLGDEPIGMLCLGATQPKALTPEEIELAQALTQQATLAIQLMRLADEAKHAAIFEERNRLAGEIHDTLAQAFTGISLQLGVAKSIAPQDPTETQRILERALQLAHAGLTEARRAVWAIYPSAAKYTDLCQMLRDVTHQLAANVPLELRVEGESYDVPALLGLNLTRIAQEAITNALKHAQASTIRVVLAYEPQDISLHISDDGCGFLPQQDTGGFGLMSLSQRSERIGGELQIHSQPGQGAEILVHVNLNGLPKCCE